jgi:hypothetical protein
MNRKRQNCPGVEDFKGNKRQHLTVSLISSPSVVIVMPILGVLSFAPAL